MTELPEYKKKDFISDQEVRWCPGCGDYAILSAVQMAMTKIGKKKEDICFISGIGCSSRFPYYMDTFGMHSIHGRAPAVASGLKIHNPNLSVWVITGDGDGMSIGGNHLIHAIRRNVDLKIILFNNEIYGLTKGQYSPTSKLGLVTKSTPYGVIDRPFIPSNLALGAGATFIARTIDTDPKHMQEVIDAASKHKGCSFIEVLQNCVIFNDKVHDTQTNRTTRDDHTVRLEHGKPMVFGKNKDRVLTFEGVTPTVKNLTEGDDGSSYIKHDEKNFNMASLLSGIIAGSELPLPLGVLRNIEAPVYDFEVEAQMNMVTSKKGEGSMKKLLYGGDTWEVK